MYLVQVKFVLFSTVQQVVLFDPFQNKFLHVCHFHVQRSRSPRDIERKMAYNIKENRGRGKKIFRQKERIRVNQTHTILLFSKTRFDNKEKNERKRKKEMHNQPRCFVNKKKRNGININKSFFVNKSYSNDYLQFSYICFCDFCMTSVLFFFSSDRCMYICMYECMCVCSIKCLFSQS